MYRRQVITLPPGSGRSEGGQFGELIVILELRQHGMECVCSARRTGAPSCRKDRGPIHL